MGKIEPISFSQLQESVLETIPDEVIDSINYLIKKNYNSYKQESEVIIDEIVNTYLGPLDDCSLRDQLFRWDIEGLYGKYGWDVSFHSPERGERFNSYYLFSKK